MNSQQQAYQAVIDLYDIAEIKDNARDINESLGFLYAITAAPQEIELHIWLPLLWKQDKAFNFSDEALANQFATTILQYYQQCLLCYQSQPPLFLMSELWLGADLQVTAQGMSFAAGYLRAFQYTEASWTALNLESGSEAQQILQTTLLLLSKMANVNCDDPQMQALFAQLPTIQKIVSSLPALLTAMGRFAQQEACDE